MVFRGFTDAREVTAILANTLILISIEDQFGLAVIDTQAMGVPTIFSPSFGARDELLRSGVNGFLVEPDNPTGITFFMKLIADLWRRLAQGARDAAPLGDVARFVTAVDQLCGMSGRAR